MEKILLVEADPNLRDVMTWTIASMGYQPITAANGEECIQKAISESPALILLDIMLPDIDGQEMIQLLRRRPVTKSVPIIAISAAWGSSVRQSCLDAGCNDYLAKPFTYELLQEKLRTFVD